MLKTFHGLFGNQENIVTLKFYNTNFFTCTAIRWCLSMNYHKGAACVKIVVVNIFSCVFRGSLQPQKCLTTIYKYFIELNLHENAFCGQVTQMYGRTTVPE